MFLVGDIGGTNTRLALMSKSSPNFTPILERRYPSASWISLEDQLREFLDSSQISLNAIRSGCLSLAGPIQNQSCTLVNLGKTIDLARLEATYSSHFPMTFCNDLVATGQGIFALAESDLYCLNPITLSTFTPVSGQNARLGSANRAVLAPGTGLGESIILSEDVICPTEGSHGDFAPRTETEIRLLRFLQQEYGHVSYERILSGPGLVNLYRFFDEESSSSSNSPLQLTPEQITQQALTKSCPLCRQALELFVQILGAEAGNLALKSLATEGVYLGGGIAPKILPALEEGSFMESFQSKGRLSGLVSRIPVFVILNEKAALYGAAILAEKLVI